MKKLHISLFRVSFVLGVCFVHFKAAGQSPQTLSNSVTIASPTAASLGKFGDIPVGYHTGVPDIQVPIYTINAGPIKLPISLSYHASGIKVMEPASWVGAGWALNAGGVITRSVQGAPDEAGSNSGGQKYGHFSNYGYNSYLFDGTGPNAQQRWDEFSSGIRDGEPDLFFFNFGGYSGKFYFRDDRTPVLVPEQDLKVIPSYSGGRSIDYFTIVTPDGTRYIFGNSPNVSGGVAPIEITNSYTYQNGAQDAPPTSAWYLNQVVSGDNAFTVNLQYQAENYGYYTLSLFPIDHTGTGLDGAYGYGLVKNIMQGVRLSQISFPNGTVTFSPGKVRTDLCDNGQGLIDGANTSATTLGAINITDGNGFCKNYNFFYDYFAGNNTPLPTTLTLGYSLSSDINRLRLDSIKETSCDNSLNVPPYKFTYYGGAVPRRLSFGVDHWGYYNGADGNTSLIPTYYVNNNPVQGATRDAAFPAMMAGMLTRIDYPTGGYNTFDFESNTGLIGTQVTSSNVLAQFQLAGPIFHQQNTTYSGSTTCTSNGNLPVTIQVQTNCNWGVYVTITDANNNVVYNELFNNTTGDPGTDAGVVTYSEVHAYTQGTPPFMPAGNYTVSVNLTNGSQTPVGGVYVEISQPVYTTVYSTTTLGGLRIKTIKAVDGLNSNPVVTNYSYTDLGGTSTAILYSVPTYAMRLRNDMVSQIGYATSDGEFTGGLEYPEGCISGGGYIISPGSIVPMRSLQGAPIGYQMVTVSQPGNGSSVYTYFTSDNGYPSFAQLQTNNYVNTMYCDQSSPNYPPAPPSFDSKRGELYSEQHYDNSGRLLKDIYYDPEFDESPILSTPAFIAKLSVFEAGSGQLGTMYSWNTVKKVSLTTVEHDYGASGGALTTTKKIYYGSKFHNQPTMTVSSTSTGDTLSTVMQYAADFRLPGCDAISDCSNQYNSDCATCTTAYNAARSSCQDDATCLTTAYENYMQCNANARISYVTCHNNYNSAVNACRVDAESKADAVLKPVLLLQDNYMNPVVETSEWRDSYLKHSNFVNFGAGSTPANFPYPVQTQLLNLQAPSASFSPAAVSGNSIAIDSRYQPESSYLFSSGNPQQVTPHSGVTQSYIWDYNNTEPIARVSGATADQVAYTSFEADGTGGWTLPSATKDASSAFTGSYSYLVTSSPITRSGLNPSTTYVVSYWSKIGRSFNVSNTTSVTRGKTVFINGQSWTYFEHMVTGTSMVSISSVDGSGDIDELRCYPANAQMETYTYSPLIGMTSHCDVGNRVTYYSYDVLGRLSFARDQDGNIVKTYQYHYKGQ